MLSKSFPLDHYQRRFYIAVHRREFEYVDIGYSEIRQNLPYLSTVIA